MKVETGQLGQAFRDRLCRMSINVRIGHAAPQRCCALDLLNATSRRVLLDVNLNHLNQIVVTALPVSAVVVALRR